MHEEFERALKEVEATIARAEREAGELGAKLDAVVRWRDPEKERPPVDDTVLLWECGAYVLGHYNPREQTWTFYGPIRRYETKSAPQAWIPLPKPPKKDNEK